MRSIFGDRDPAEGTQLPPTDSTRFTHSVAGYPVDHPIKYVCYCWKNMLAALGCEQMEFWGHIFSCSGQH